jgi:hypothetical protein
VNTRVAEIGMTTSCRRLSKNDEKQESGEEGEGKNQISKQKW